ncbi:MAG: hypothetical protein P4L22_03585 [Candidatus Babeliales bacterium]|nr:hypothetical protein [Candidatus Babeliales bacterium]
MKKLLYLVKALSISFIVLGLTTSFLVKTEVVKKVVKVKVKPKTTKVQPKPKVTVKPKPVVNKPISVKATGPITTPITVPSTPANTGTGLTTVLPVTSSTPVTIPEASDSGSSESVGSKMEDFFKKYKKELEIAGLSAAGLAAASALGLSGKAAYSKYQQYKTQQEAALPEIIKTEQANVEKTAKIAKQEAADLKAAKNELDAVKKTGTAEQKADAQDKFDEAFTKSMASTKMANQAKIALQDAKKELIEAKSAAQQNVKDTTNFEKGNAKQLDKALEQARLKAQADLKTSDSPALAKANLEKITSQQAKIAAQNKAKAAQAKADIAKQEAKDAVGGLRSSAKAQAAIKAQADADAARSKAEVANAKAVTAAKNAASIESEVASAKLNYETTSKKVAAEVSALNKGLNDYGQKLKAEGLSSQAIEAKVKAYQKDVVDAGFKKLQNEMISAEAKLLNAQGKPAPVEKAQVATKAEAPAVVKSGPPALSAEQKAEIAARAELARVQAEQQLADAQNELANAEAPGTPAAGSQAADNIASPVDANNDDVTYSVNEEGDVHFDFNRG